jgi:hypothetical protein
MSQPAARKFERKPVVKRTAIQIKNFDEMQPNYDESQPQAEERATNSLESQKISPSKKDSWSPAPDAEGNSGTYQAQKEVQGNVKSNGQNSSVKHQPSPAKGPSRVHKDESNAQNSDGQALHHSDVTQSPLTSQSQSHGTQDHLSTQNYNEHDSPLQNKNGVNKYATKETFAKSAELGDSRDQRPGFNRAPPRVSIPPQANRPKPRMIQPAITKELTVEDAPENNGDISWFNSQEHQTEPQEEMNHEPIPQVQESIGRTVSNNSTYTFQNTHDSHLKRNVSDNQGQSAPYQKHNPGQYMPQEVRRIDSRNLTKGTTVPTEVSTELMVETEHSKLLPFRSSNIQELANLVVHLSSNEPSFELFRLLLSCGINNVKGTLLGTPDEDISQILGISDEWFQYYLKQFLLYSSDCDYYEPWEALVMAIFNSDNKISSLPHLEALRSERYDDKNPTKILLDITNRSIRDDSMFFSVFCYAISKDCFNPDVLPLLIEDYLTQIRHSSSDSDFWSRFSVFLALFPQLILRPNIIDLLSSKISQNRDMFAALTELTLKRIVWDKANLHVALWFAISLCEFCLRRNLIESAEEYIKFITSNRTASEVANDTNFTQEFRRVRALYFESFEKNKQVGVKGGSAIDQVFGFMKGIVNTTVGKPKEAQTTSSEGVQWDPVAKRWLINGVIPPDNEAEEREKEAAKPSGPPPMKKAGPPPQSQEANPSKRSGLSQKQKFVAYQIGNQ